MNGKFSATATEFARLLKYRELGMLPTRRKRDVKSHKETCRNFVKETLHEVLLHPVLSVQRKTESVVTSSASSIHARIITESVNRRLRIRPVHPRELLPVVVFSSQGVDVCQCLSSHVPLEVILQHQCSAAPGFMPSSRPDLLEEILAMLHDRHYDYVVIQQT